MYVLNVYFTVVRINIIVVKAAKVVTPETSLRDVGTSEKVRGPAKFRSRFKWTSTT